jgi:hypothetical protein
MYKIGKLSLLFQSMSFKEAIGTMVSLVMEDSNQKELEAKGSGIQRVLLLSLIKYNSENTKKTVIWGIDEPEAFLQPGCRRRCLLSSKNCLKILKFS